MFDDPAELNPAALRLRADACRTSAEKSHSPEPQVLWIERAEYWEELAFEAAKHSQRKKAPPLGPGQGVRAGCYESQYPLSCHRCYTRQDDATLQTFFEDSSDHSRAPHCPRYLCAGANQSAAERSMVRIF